MPPPPPILPAPPVAQPPFYSVSLLKLTVLSLVTFSLYDLYWCYQNWKLIQARTGEKIIPLGRAFFGIIWIYPLLRRVREYLQATKIEGENPAFPAGPLATAWIIITLLYKLPNPFWLISSLSFIPLLMAQSRINRINAAAAPEVPLNSRFTRANWIWIVIGGLFFIFAIIGSFMPDNS